MSSLKGSFFVLFTILALSGCSPDVPEKELEVVALEERATMLSTDGYAMFSRKVEEGQLVVAFDEEGNAYYYSFVLYGEDGLIFAQGRRVPLNTYTTALALVFINPTLGLLSPDSKKRVVPLVLEHELWDELVSALEEGYRQGLRPAQNTRAVAVALRIASDTWQKIVSKSKRVELKSLSAKDIEIRRDGSRIIIENRTPLPYIVAQCDGDWGKRAGELLRQGKLPDTICHTWWLPGKLVEIKIDSSGVRANLVDPKGFTRIIISHRPGTTLVVVRVFEAVMVSRQIEEKVGASPAVLEPKGIMPSIYEIEVPGGGTYGFDIQDAWAVYSLVIGLARGNEGQVEGAVKQLVYRGIHLAGTFLLASLGVPPPIAGVIVDVVLTLLTDGELGGFVGKFIVGVFDELFGNEWEEYKVYKDFVRGQIAQAGVRVLNAADLWVKSFVEAKQKGLSYEQSFENALAQFKAYIDQYRSNSQEYSKFLNILSNNPAVQSLPKTSISLVEVIGEIFPQVQKVVPNKVKPGQTLSIYGEDFGNRKGKVKLLGKELKIIKWTDTVIRVRIPKEIFEDDEKSSPPLRPTSRERIVYLEIQTADGSSTAHPVFVYGSSRNSEDAIVGRGDGGEGGGCTAVHPVALAVLLVPLALSRRRF